MNTLEVPAKQSFRYDSITLGFFLFLMWLPEVVRGVGGEEMDEVSQKKQNSICKINNY